MANKNVKATKVKNKSNKKKFNWNKVLFYLKSLVNNGVCKEIGIKHWIISIPIFLISMCLAVLPIFTSQATLKGSSSISSKYNDQLSEVIYNYVNDDEALDLKLNDHTLSLKEDNNKSSTLLETYTHDNYRFDIYYINTTDGNPSYSEAANLIITNNSLTLKSYMFLSSNYYTIQIKDSNGSQILSSAAGNYNSMEDFSSFKTLLLQDVDTSLTINEVKSSIMNNVYKFANTAYNPLRWSQTFTYTGIVLGVNAGLTLVLIPILFLMTRGKRNPNRTIKFYEVMGITFHATLTPSLITLVLGYILGSQLQYMMMLYIMTFGFRAMRLSMKYLRPPVEQ